MTREEIEDFIEEVFPAESLTLADNMDDAFIGLVSDRWGDSPPKAVYSISGCIKLIKEMGMSAPDAEEYFSYNVEGAYVGEGTPLFIHTPE